MNALPDISTLRATLITLAISAIGAALAWLLSIPAPVLTGPATLVSLASLAGLRTEIAPAVREVCFVVLGVGIGAGFTRSAGSAILTWPLAFVALGLGLAATMLICRFVLERGFGFDRRTALLASAPGHMSFVMSLAADTRADVGRVAVVQSIRLLALTLLVPFAALAMGFPAIHIGIAPELTLTPLPFLLLVAGGGALGLVLRRFRTPAPTLLGGMIVSGLTHVTELVPGAVPSVVLVPAFVVLGALIGSRFSGMSLTTLKLSLGAGVAATLVAAIIAALTAVPVAAALGFPLAHVLAAFSPGGLETMIALGAALGANPGFVTACHVMRLLILSVMVPFFLGGRQPSEVPQPDQERH
ncbi:AbrB family transcriptional regulator [Pseudooceanicola sp.]|uniref:AbrB family transcriptional regulator n=1 Tax=Pseudooceanicola sp. TaxID=1914328 RepID=UPI0035185292